MNIIKMAHPNDGTYFLDEICRYQLALSNIESKAQSLN